MKREDGKKSRWSYSQLERMIYPEWLFHPGNEEYKRVTIIAYPTALIAVVALILISGLRLIQHNYVIGFIDLSMALILVGIVLYHRKTKTHHHYVPVIFGVTAYGIFLILSFFTGSEKTTHLWSYIFPLIAFPLLGPRRGTIAVILFLIPISLLLILDLSLSFMTFYSKSITFSFIPSIFAVSGLSYLYERIRERNQQQLNLANAALRRSNDEMEQQIQERTAELARSEENYRFLTEKMSDVVWTADLNLNVTYVSPSVNKILGFSQEEYRELPFHEKVTPDSFNKAMAALALGLEREKMFGANPERNLQIELEFRHKDGSAVWMESMLNPIRNKEGNLVGIHGVSRDITDRKQKEKTLRKQSGKLRELSAKLSEAEEVERRRISRELHDQVGQNLATLGLNLNILQSMISKESTVVIQRRLEDSLVMLEQTTEFIRDLMADLRPPVLDDYGLMAAIRWYGKRFSLRTGIEFTFRGEDASPRPKALIEVTLFRIFQEALINVLKHSRAKKVEVSGEVNKNKLKLAIVDNGVGFDLNTLQEIDERHGWGLTTMAERAESIGGSFAIESQPGYGTKITIEAAI